MLHPSFKEMIQKMNESAGEENKKITSRYSLVIAAAKRARQVNAGSDPLVEVEEGAKAKNLSVAVNELYAGKVRILEDDEPIEEDREYTDESIYQGFADVDYSDENEDDEDEVGDYDEEEENEE